VCTDLTRGGAYVPGGDDGGAAGDVWRRALCLPACAVAGDCRVGFSCRELPVLSAGGVPGGAYSWKRGCFADIGGDDGDSCFSATGQVDNSRCLSGRCDPYGARGLCTSDCSTNADCPTTAACATYNAPPSGPATACLRRCDMKCDGDDPMLGCQGVNQPGGLGFVVTPGEPSGGTYCSPLLCMTASQCLPSGTCTPISGGSYCLRN
jgi:hypothetical protein